jgi:hypothetical protein
MTNRIVGIRRWTPDFFLRPAQFDEIRTQAEYHDATLHGHRSEKWPFVFGFYVFSLTAVKDPIKTDVVLWPCDIQDL